MPINLVIQKPDNLNLILLTLLMLKTTKITAKNHLIIFLISYLYCDYWMFLLHIFLDQKKTQKSNLNVISDLSKIFEEHHQDPKTILTENHVTYIKILMLISLFPQLINNYFFQNHKLYRNVFLLLNYFNLYVSFLGILAAMNHYFCHAITHKNKLVKLNFQFKLFSFFQKMKLLPTNEHHRIHHTPPHQKNWNLLNGLNIFYTKMYFLSNKNYNLLSLLFYTTNPMLISWIFNISYLTLNLKKS